MREASTTTTAAPVASAVSLWGDKRDPFQNTERRSDVLGCAVPARQLKHCADVKTDPPAPSAARAKFGGSRSERSEADARRYRYR